MCDGRRQTGEAAGRQLLYLPEADASGEKAIIDKESAAPMLIQNVEREQERPRPAGGGDWIDRQSN